MTPMLAITANTVSTKNDSFTMPRLLTTAKNNPPTIAALRSREP